MSKIRFEKSPSHQLCLYFSGQLSMGTRVKSPSGPVFQNKNPHSCMWSQNVIRRTMGRRGGGNCGNFGN